MKIQSDFLSRSALLWLLTALVAGLIPHIPRLPLWITGCAALSILWRFMMHLGRWPAPTWPIKTVLVIAGFAGVYLTYGRSFSIESMVALLSAGAVLKPLEAYTRRDTYVLIFLCYFLISTEFLFDQSLLTALYVFWALSLAMTAQVSINQGHKSAKRAHLLALKLLAQSIPLAVVLFILVPRLAPLWSLNLKTQSAVTGLSDSMTPGDIAQLSLSDSLAFRVTFDGEAPPKDQLYWRALVMDQFDGTTWKPTELRPPVEWFSAQNFQIENDEAIQYEVMMEPNEERWLFALDKASPQTVRTGVTSDFRLVSKDKVFGKKLYKASSDLNALLSPGGLDIYERRVNLRIPEGENERTRELARTFLATSQSSLDYLNQVRGFYLSTAFFYTLKPKPLGKENSIDQFLFESRRGFCAHYAGSLTYLMRLGGIPARVVTGYQGGEFNEEGNYLAVYQFDAHAWVEVWLEGTGWTRIDPTSWVAPERVEQGIQQAVKDEFLADTVISVHKLKELEWLYKLRQKMDAVNYYWNDWVLSYTAEKQQDMLKKLFGARSYFEYAWIVLAVLASVVAAVALGLFVANREPAKPPLVRAFYTLKKMLEKKGLAIEDGMSPSKVTELAAEKFPANKTELVGIGKLFDAYFYGAKSDTVSASELASLRQRIMKLKLKQ